MTSPNSSRTCRHKTSNKRIRPHTVPGASHEAENRMFLSSGLSQSLDNIVVDGGLDHFKMVGLVGGDQFGLWLVKAVLL